MNQQHTSTSAFALLTFSRASGCSRDKPSGSERDLSGGCPGLEQCRTRGHVLAVGARHTPEKKTRSNAIKCVEDFQKNQERDPYSRTTVRNGSLASAP